MPNLDLAGTFKLGARTVRRMGYGAMQLAGPGVFGPPKDRTEAVAVLRAAVAAGVNHIDTSDFYGPHVTNQLIREALHPYPEDLVIATKVGARRGADGSWNKAASRAELTEAVHDNLRNLGVEALDLVNFRWIGDGHGLSEGSLEEPFSALVDLQRQGLIRGLGVSNVTIAQIAEARGVADLACVQNHYNLVHRGDDGLIDRLLADGIAYVPYFPLGGFSPLQSTALTAVAEEAGATAMQVALAWLLQRRANILLIPGTSSRDHLAQNLAAASLKLTPGQLSVLEGLGEESPAA